MGQKKSTDYNSISEYIPQDPFFDQDDTHFKLSFSKIIKAIETNKFVTLLLFLSIFCLSIAYALNFSWRKSPDNNIEIIEEGMQEDTKILIVDLEGAVIKPGIYKLKEGSRIHDLLIAASGLSASADREWIAKYLNLATKLVDGAKLYIPYRNENTPEKTFNKNKEVPETLGVTAGQININNASIDELDTLPQIGTVRAQKIIDNRPYQSIEELLTKKAVSASVFEKIKNKITVY